MTTEQNPALVLPKTNLLRSPDFKSYYVNWAQASSTPFDICLVVGQASPSVMATPTEQPVIEVEEKARLSFHPAEAKVIVMMITQALVSYEKQFGEVSIPAGAVLENIDELKELISKSQIGEKKTEGD